MPETNELLLGRVANGDEEAFMQFYDAFAPRVYGLLVKLLGPDRSESDDVLQDVFWEVWQKAGRFDPALGSPATWVLMMARARAVDRLRKRSRGPVRSDEPAADRATRQRDPSLVEPVRSALARLPDDQRSVITMAFYGGLTRDQIATSTGLPVGTVKTRIRSGISRLRELLEPAEVS